MVDWNTQCEAISRKTNQRCPHKCSTQIPSILAGHFVLDRDYFSVEGRPVHLCKGHASSWWKRQRRLLTIRLIDGGYLSAYNQYGYGSTVTTCERIPFGAMKKLKIPKAWGPVKWEGSVPSDVVASLGIVIEAKGVNP